jgi:hypothetical protein
MFWCVYVCVFSLNVLVFVCVCVFGVCVYVSLVFVCARADGALFYFYLKAFWGVCVCVCVCVGGCVCSVSTTELHT